MAGEDVLVGKEIICQNVFGSFDSVFSTVVTAQSEESIICKVGRKYIFSWSRCLKEGTRESGNYASSSWMPCHCFYGFKDRIECRFFSQSVTSTNSSFNSLTLKFHLARSCHHMHWPWGHTWKDDLITACSSEVFHKSSGTAICRMALGRGPCDTTGMIKRGPA